MSHDWAALFGKEWPYVCRLGSVRDPEEKRAFWETVKAKKLADRNYSIYTDFPRDVVHEEAAAKARDACCSYVLSLKKPAPSEPKPQPRTHEQKVLGELIFQGFHLPEDERKKRGIA